MKAQPISDSAFEELSVKFGLPVSELRKIAAELNVARPRLETHLIVLEREKKKKDSYLR